MATESPPGGGTQVFARKATGLRREASARDVFIYNTNNQNIGIGVAFMVLLIPPLYAGASMVVATILAGLLALPMAGVYAYFAAAMPRSGGDYVYIGRTLHPFLGFLASWNWVVWLITYTGIPAAYLAQYGLSGLCRELGFVFNSPRLLSYGDNFTRKWWVFTAGSLLLIFFAVVFALGTRLYFRIQNVTFAIAMVGVVAGLVVLAVKGHRDAASGLNTYIRGVGGVHNATASLAKYSNNLQQSGFDLKQTLYAMVWPLFITLYAITSSFIGGEVRNARRSQFLAMPGSIVYVPILMLLLVVGLDHATGTTLLGQLGYPLPQDVPSVLGISAIPTYNELIAAMAHNQGWLMVILGVSFVFWTYVWLPINFLAATRAFLAWAFDGLFPRKLAEVSDRYHTPIIAIAATWVLSEVCLYLYVDQIFNTLNGIFAWIWSFVLCSIAAMVFPYRRRELWRASPWNGSTLGIPNITILGAVSTACLLFCEYWFWYDPIQGFDTWGTTLRWVMGLIIPTAAVIYGFASFMSRRAGVPLDKAFAEIPPE
ncbi:MAG: APC family permease [Gaiellales bacterium]